MYIPLTHNPGEPTTFPPAPVGISEEDQVALALQISVLDITSEEEQVALAINESLRDVHMKKSEPEPEGGFIWPCDEDPLPAVAAAEVVSPEEPDCQSRRSSSSTTPSTAAYIRHEHQLDRERQESRPPTQPLNQRELQNLLLYLEEGALDDHPHLEKPREILTKLLWQLKLEGELLIYVWRGQHEAAWLEIRNTLSPKLWTDSMKRFRNTHPRLETPRGAKIKRNHENCEPIDNEVIRNWVVCGGPESNMMVDIPGRGPTPLTNRVFVANIPYIVDDRKLTEVFSVSGRVVFAQVIRDGNGYSKGMGLVEYTHQIEALQAIRMMRQAKLYNRDITVRPDVIGPFPNTYDGIPEGLTDVSGGLGTEGMKLKVEILEGTPFVHSPDCGQMVFLR